MKNFGGYILVDLKEKFSLLEFTQIYDQNHGLIKVWIDPDSFHIDFVGYFLRRLLSLLHFEGQYAALSLNEYA